MHTYSLVFSILRLLLNIIIITTPVLLRELHDSDGPYYKGHTILCPL